MEAFVAMEITKQLGWSRTRATLHHFRSHDQKEVDLVLEAPDGRVVGIEVKASATVRAGQAAGLRFFADALGERFHQGLLLHPGREAVPLGDRLWALPLDALWRWGAT